MWQPSSTCLRSVRLLPSPYPPPLSVTPPPSACLTCLLCGDPGREETNVAAFLNLPPSVRLLPSPYPPPLSVTPPPSACLTCLLCGDPGREETNVAAFLNLPPLRPPPPLPLPSASVCHPTPPPPIPPLPASPAFCVVTQDTLRRPGADQCGSLPQPASRQVARRCLRGQWGTLVVSGQWVRSVVSGQWSVSGLRSVVSGWVIVKSRIGNHLICDPLHFIQSFWVATWKGKDTVSMSFEPITTQVHYSEATLFWG